MLGKPPEQFIWLLLTVLAVWRVTAFLAYERGPWELAVHFRRLGVRLGLGRLVGCFYCLSLWAAACTVLLVFSITAATPVVIFGVAGAVGVIERFLTRDANTGGGDNDGI